MLGGGLPASRRKKKLQQQQNRSSYRRSSSPQGGFHAFSTMLNKHNNNRSSSRSTSHMHHHLQNHSNAKAQHRSQSDSLTTSWQPRGAAGRFSSATQQNNGWQSQRCPDCNACTNTKQKHWKPNSCIQYMVKLVRNLAGDTAFRAAQSLTDKNSGEIMDTDDQNAPGQQQQNIGTIASLMKDSLNSFRESVERQIDDLAQHLKSEQRRLGELVEEVTQKNADEMAGFMEKFLKTPEFNKNESSQMKAQRMRDALMNSATASLVGGGAHLQDTLYPSTEKHLQEAANNSHHGEMSSIQRKLFIENQNTPAMSLQELDADKRGTASLHPEANNQKIESKSHRMASNDPALATAIN